MVRGVSFEVADPSINLLHKILDCIEPENYCWHNIQSQNETWTNLSLEEDFLDKDYYSGTDFSNLIIKEHFIIFLKLQAYDRNSDYYFSEVQTYEEFRTSDCQLLLLVNDCRFVEIYANNINLTQKLYKNALLNNWDKICYITEQNDLRLRMFVL